MFDTSIYYAIKYLLRRLKSIVLIRFNKPKPSRPIPVTAITASPLVKNVIIAIIMYFFTIIYNRILCSKDKRSV